MVQETAHSQGKLLGEELKVRSLTENLAAVRLQLRNTKNEAQKLEQNNQRLINEQISKVQLAVDSEFEAHRKRTVEAVAKQLSPATKQSLAKRHCKEEPTTPGQR